MQSFTVFPFECPSDLTALRAEVRDFLRQHMPRVDPRWFREGTDAIMLHSADEFKMKAVNDVFQQKLVKRGVPLKGLTYGPLEPAAGSTVKQKITLQQGIPIEKAREIVKLVKNSKKKAQASIQADVVRISSKDRDTLQEIIAMVKQEDFGIDLQFTNYRSN